jgi:hypothetical protein
MTPKALRRLQDLRRELLGARLEPSTADLAERTETAAA